MRSVVLVRTLWAIGLLAGNCGPALSGEYNVFCSNDKIEVEQRTLEQQLDARGTPTCQFSSFSSYSSALDFAQKNFGGEDKPCACGN